MEVLFLLLFFISSVCAASEISLRFVFIIEGQELDLTQDIGTALKAAEEWKPELHLDEEIVFLDRENEDDSYQSLCSAMSRGASLMVDLSWSPWEMAEQLSSRWRVPLVRTLLSSQQLVGALDQYLEYRNATDAAVLLETEMDVDKTLYHLLGASNVRVWVHAGLSRDAARALRRMRPEPGFHALVGGGQFVADTYARAVKEQLVRRDFRWSLALTDYRPPDHSSLVRPTMLLHLDPLECCKLIGGKEDCVCPTDLKRQQLILTALLQLLSEELWKLEAPPIRVVCDDLDTPPTSDPPSTPSLYKQLAVSTAGNDSLFYWDANKLSLFLRSRFILSSYKPGEAAERVAVWSAGEQFTLLPGVALEPLRMFFRIGTWTAIPWTFPKVDPLTGAAVLDAEGTPLYEGYCIDLMQRLSEHLLVLASSSLLLPAPPSSSFAAGPMAASGLAYSFYFIILTMYQTMDFDYEIVSPRAGGFGRKLPNGSWDGVVGDLMRGETDMAIAALTMTAEREEVIDFVPPYFEQTGILIVIRKPTRKTSLFKFMTVLRTEVWLSIVAALVLTGLMIWLLDKYSPYSARNNPDAYPYPCREFTLKESFWFALTSFTPQGGGEAPKALSGRTLVAAYWLFVVLMLATFTANLAAFLTVERMQTPVASLEQLARQSRINYTVVEGSTVHQYFINMKFAEDTLYRVWKEITLNATSDQAQYRVWDYPIREQYGHILLAINASGPVPDAATGFQQVNEHTEADFAFIHDSAEIRYEITKNCNLTEVGEIFAEQPYAIAVQQGSRLQEDLSRALLDLQKERFLEQLGAKYWNESARLSCPDADESEGITLESLGGVFIATLFGLGLAMVTLAWEVFYYKRKEKNKVLAIDNEKPVEKKTLEKKVAAGVAKLRKRNKKNVTIGDSFKPVGKGTVSYISVYPKGDTEYRP